MFTFVKTINNKFIKVDFADVFGRTPVYRNYKVIYNVLLIKKGNTNRVIGDLYITNTSWKYLVKKMEYWDNYEVMKYESNN